MTSGPFCTILARFKLLLRVHFHVVWVPVEQRRAISLICRFYAYVAPSGTNLKNETCGFMTYAEFHEMSIYAYFGQMMSELRSVKFQNVGFGEATDA